MFSGREKSGKRECVDTAEESLVVQFFSTDISSMSIFSDEAICKTTGEPLQQPPENEACSMQIPLVTSKKICDPTKVLPGIQINMSASAVRAPHTWLSLSPTPVAWPQALQPGGSVQGAPGIVLSAWSKGRIQIYPNNDHKMWPQNFVHLFFREICFFREINYDKLYLTTYRCAWIDTAQCALETGSSCTIQNCSKHQVIKSPSHPRKMRINGKPGTPSAGPSLRRKSTLASSFLFSSKATCR